MNCFLSLKFLAKAKHIYLCGCDLCFHHQEWQYRRRVNRFMAEYRSCQCWQTAVLTVKCNIVYLFLKHIVYLLNVAAIFVLTKSMNCLFPLPTFLSRTEQKTVVANLSRVLVSFCSFQVRMLSCVEVCPLTAELLPFSATPLPMTPSRQRATSVLCRPLTWGPSVARACRWLPPWSTPSSPWSASLGIW